MTLLSYPDIIHIAVHMRLEGVVADALIMLAPEVYGPMAEKNSAGLTVVYVQLTLGRCMGALRAV